MGIGKYRVDSKGKIRLNDYPTESGLKKSEKAEILEKTEANRQKMALLQEKMYAEGKEGLIIILQALDAAGKDGIIKHVMTGVNPQGIDVCSFKQPSKEELGHGFLWRAEKCIPTRGKIGLFNRSYYEDVLVVRVHNIHKSYQMPERVLNVSDEDFFRSRYKQINNYEDYLYENGYRVVKIFLNISKDEQKQRFLDRIDDPNKNWKVSSTDLKERGLWDDYRKTFEDVIGNTSTKEAPWYIVPADQKWYTRYIVSEIILDVLEKIDPKFPEMSEEERSMLSSNREALMSE